MKTLFNDNVNNLEAYIMFRIKEKVNSITPELVAKNRAPISLSMGAPTKNPPEFVINALKEALSEKGVHTYSSPKGEEYYRKAIAQKMESEYNVKLDPATEIYSLIGSKEGIANLIRALINPKANEEEKDIIMIPDPGYASYKEMVKVSGGLPFSIPLTKENNYMPEPEEILEQVKISGLNPEKVKAFLINYPNNPLGVCANMDYLKKVVDFCKKHEILLISDAAYAELYFKPELKPASILEIEGAKDVSVEFFSFSKPYAMTGWRLGWICGNKEIIRNFGKLKTTIDSGIFKALQIAAAKILNSKEGDEYIKQANIEFQEKQRIFIEGLKELGWENLEIPDATFYLWLPIPPRYKTSMDFTNDLMHKSGIVAAPGDAFGKYGEGYFRASIVCTEEEIHEVIRRMKEDGFYFN